MSEDSPSSNSAKTGISNPKPPQTSLSPEKYARLRAEAKAPYRSVRRFFYLGFAASGAMGAFIFFTQALAGREISQALPNLAVQLGVIALMVWLLRTDQAKIKPSTPPKETNS